MPLAFVERFPEFSAYHDTVSGTVAFLTHTYPPERLGSVADALRTMWTAHYDAWREDYYARAYDRGYRRTDPKMTFTAMIRTMDSTLADSLIWCRFCDLVHTEGITTLDHATVCRACVAEYFHTCTECDGFARWLTTVSEDRELCGACLDRSGLEFCGDCDVYFSAIDRPEHMHPIPSCCESPAVEFTMRNDGCDPLANDTRVTITLPVGVISADGLHAIRTYLAGKGEWTAYDAAHSIGDEWQTREGNWTKRLSRTLYKMNGQKLSPEILSEIGNIASAHTVRNAEYAIEITRNLNLPAHEFAHADSCWWQGYSRSRCALKTNGGFGLRAFDADGKVVGRVWVMPLRAGSISRIISYGQPIYAERELVPCRCGYPECTGMYPDPYPAIIDRTPDVTEDVPTLVPTFDTMGADAFVVFNGYGVLDGYTAARVVSHMLGMPYRKIGFSSSPMYVNSGGFLIAPEDIAKRYADESLNLSLDAHSELHSRENVGMAFIPGTDPEGEDDEFEEDDYDGFNYDRDEY